MVLGPDSAVVTPASLSCLAGLAAELLPDEPQDSATVAYGRTFPNFGADSGHLSLIYQRVLSPTFSPFPRPDRLARSTPPAPHPQPNGGGSGGTATRWRTTAPRRSSRR